MMGLKIKKVIYEEVYNMSINDEIMSVLSIIEDNDNPDKIFLWSEKEREEYKKKIYLECDKDPETLKAVDIVIEMLNSLKLGEIYEIDY